MSGDQEKFSAIKKADAHVARGEAFDLVMILSDLELGGAQRVAVELANDWARVGHRLCLVTLSSDASDFFVPATAVRRVSLDAMVTSRSIASATFRNLYRILVLRRAIRNARCRRVLSFVGSTNVLAILATIGLRAMVVVSERNDPSRQSLGFFWDRLRRLTYRCATVVTANSGHALKAMKGFVPGHKLRYVPNAVSGRLQTLVERKPIILAVGRMVAQKAWDVLIDGFALVAGELPQWRLVFVGRGELEPLLRERAKARGIEARVDWAGLVADVGPYYADASIFALPSRYEGTSNALLEAMAAGVPVIVSAAVNPDADIVSNGASGIVIPTGDTSAMSAAIRVLATNPALRARLAEAARVTVDRFSPETVRETWESVLGLTPATAAADLRRSP